MSPERFRSGSGAVRERFALACARVCADQGIKGAGIKGSRDWISLQDQSDTVTVGTRLELFGFGAKR